jgi:hypothetical protein
MKLVAISVVALALVAPAARAQNRDTSTDDTKSTARDTTTDTSKSTATGKTLPADRDRPAAARSRDLGKADDECMCECNGKMIKGTKGRPMGRSPSGMDRSTKPESPEAKPESPEAKPDTPR